MNSLDLARRVTGTVIVTVLTCGGIACGGATFAAVDSTDASSSPDGRPGKDAGTTDGAHAHDAKTGDAQPADVGSPADTGSSDDSSVPDAAPPKDTGTHDTGTPRDTGVDAPIGPGCQGTPPSGPCTTAQQTCEYTTGVCICSHGAPPTEEQTWHCTTLPTGCPDPQPALHSACTQPGLVCDYGECLGGEAFECTKGTGGEDKWEQGGTGCPG